MMKKLSLLVATFTLLALPLQVGMAQDNVDLPPEIANMQSEGFTIVPANPNPPESSNFTFELGPGSEVRESVIIKNLSTEPATFYLYGADPTFSQQGTKAYKTRADSGEGEGQWITFDEPEVLLQGGEQKQAFFTLKIPQDTSFGEYRAGIEWKKPRRISTIQTSPLLRVLSCTQTGLSPTFHQQKMVRRTECGRHTISGSLSLSSW
ncbi:MAG TPA: hypothetical protein PKA32_00130 [Candidatus Gracilibacteria bacterium]|nr:hypothetical protein [Candidatus Gracilibacteria bacterium]